MSHQAEDQEVKSQSEADTEVKQGISEAEEDEET